MNATRLPQSQPPSAPSRLRVKTLFFPHSRNAPRAPPRSPLDTTAKPDSLPPDTGGTER